MNNESPAAERSRRPTWREMASMPGRRLFVAVPLSEPARERIVELVSSLRDEPARPTANKRQRRREVRWVRLDGLHLTIRFLGPTAHDRIPPLADAVRRAAVASEPFSLTIDGGGAFPDDVRPRALWLAVTDGSDRLADLAEDVNRELVAAGWPPSDRPFRAHLTLARTDGVAAGAEVARRLVDAATGIAVRSEVDRLVLYESITGSGPARYQPVAQCPLAGRP